MADAFALAAGTRSVRGPVPFPAPAAARVPVPCPRHEQAGPSAGAEAMMAGEGTVGDIGRNGTTVKIAFLNRFR